MKKQPFDDETLMAFADGELDPATAAAVEEAINRDDELMARVAMFMETRARAKSEMGPLLDQPVPAKLEWAVREMVEASRKTSAGSGGTVSKAAIPIETARRRRSAWQAGNWALPLAASLVAAVAAGIAGYELGNGGAAGGIAGTADPDVIAALQTLPSGEERPLAEAEGRIRIVSSFRDQEGAFCREYEIDPAQAASIVAVSCMEANEWRTRISIASPVSGDGYAPASSMEALEAYLSAIDAGPALSQEEEAEALAGLR